jgi:Na+:H+ antiporter, NhaA family
VVFLTALAIFDDLGGILVIALFYGHGLHVGPLLGALGACAGLFALNRAQVRGGLPYAGLGLALWWLLHDGGIHATIAGVILGMAVPARSSRPAREVLVDLHSYAGGLLGGKADEDLDNEQILHIEEKLEDLEPPLNRFVHALHPYVAFVIVPVFALVNSGVSVRGMSLADLAQPIPAGTALGLFLGKQLGIFAATLGAIVLGISPMPGGARRLQLYGVSVVAGIGFTVALFIAALAFPDHPASLDQAKLGILLGSFVSAVVGYALLRFGPAPSRAS